MRQPSVKVRCGYSVLTIGDQLRPTASCPARVSAFPALNHEMRRVSATTATKDRDEGPRRRTETISVPRRVCQRSSRGTVP